MSELREIQQAMAGAVMQPLTQGETMRRRSKSSEAACIIKPNDRLTSFERLEIYNRQYWFRICASFEEDFPGLQAVVGRKRFERMTVAYLTENPSTSFTLRNLGAMLENWLNAHRELIEPRADLALDMARIEWAHIEAFDGAAEPSLSQEDLLAVDENTRLHLQPHLKLLELRYPVDDLLIAIHDHAGSSDTASNNAVTGRRNRAVRTIADLPQEGIWLAVHRHENSVYYRRLAKEDFLMLKAFYAGKTLAEAIETGFAESEIPVDGRQAFLREAFQSWSSLGWFVRPGTMAFSLLG